MRDKTNKLYRRLHREREPQRYCAIESESSPQTSSQSDSSQSSVTTQSDMRIVGGDGSINLSSQNSSVGVTVTTTDAGTVNQAFGFARDALKQAIDFSVGSATRNTQVLEHALEGVKDSEAQVADAYTTAKAGEQKILVAGALVIVGLVAVAALKGFAK